MFMVNEYRRVKVRAYARLSEDRREQLITLVCLVATFACFYLEAYLDLTWLLYMGLAVSVAFFLWANAGALRWGVRMARELVGVRHND